MVSTLILINMAILKDSMNAAINMTHVTELAITQKCRVIKASTLA